MILLWPLTCHQQNCIYKVTWMFVESRILSILIQKMWKYACKGSSKHSCKHVLWKKSCRDLKNVYIRIIPSNFTFPYEVWSVLIEWSQQQIKCDGQPLTVYQVFWLFQLTVILFHCLFHVPVLFHLQIRMGTEKLGNKYLTASGQVRPWVQSHLQGKRASV